MIIDNSNNWRSPVRKIGAKVELNDSSTFLPTDALKSFTIERVGEASKFFGYGICQKANVHILDVNRERNITTANSLKIFLSSGGEYIDGAPEFAVTEVHRDENTNELSITAYDALYNASTVSFADLALRPPYTIQDVATACALLLGLDGVSYEGFPSGEGWVTRSYREGANYDGTETIREVLDDVAEAIQAIYYVNSVNKLVYKRMDAAGAPVLSITKDDYIELDSKTNRRLSAIVSTTELGDNVGASLDVSGTTQYVRDNPFWDLREDIADIVDEALEAIGGLTINQFNCSWRGNFALELGDKIAITAKDNSLVNSYVLNDVISYDGGLAQSTEWSYEAGEETENNPTSLGEVIKQTYAKVDKANKTIDLVAAETTKLRLEADKLNITISSLQEEIDSKPDMEDIDVEVTEVTTTTGFTFNKDGLTITKNNSELSTQITEDGLTISKANEELLKVDNEGVKAEDLHATTYLIIGRNSRFEDFAGDRTACIWIGGRGVI